MHKLAVSSLGMAILSFMLKSLPYLQYTAVVLGIAASIISMVYHLKKLNAED